MAYVTLTPIAMRRPNRLCIYAPNPFKQNIKRPEPVLRLCDSVPTMVSFEPDGVSDPQHRQAYFLRDGLVSGWYIIGEWETDTLSEKRKETINE